jgi:phosphohistidine phosphatase SixA
LQRSDVKTVLILIALLISPRALPGQAEGSAMFRQIKHPIEAVMPASLTLFLVRHAEKPDSGPALSDEGRARAQAYVSYFQRLTNDSGQPIRWDYLLAAKESDQSNRCVSTLEPLAQAIHKPIDSQFKDKHYERLVDYLRLNPGRQFDHANVLICWHHGEILELAKALGVRGSDLPESSHWPRRWPDGVYGWVLKVHFNADGTLDRNHTEAVNEALMPEDTAVPAYGK